MFLFWSKTSLKASVHARTCSKLWFPQSLLESSKSGSRFFIIHLNFHQKSAKISIFRLISSYFFSSRAWISLWSSISISSILWQPFWMHICTFKPFQRMLTIENWGRMSQIRPKSGKIGSKTIFFCQIFVCSHEYSLLDFPDAQLNETLSWKFYDQRIIPSSL